MQREAYLSWNVAFCSTRMLVARVHKAVLSLKRCIARILFNRGDPFDLVRSEFKEERLVRKLRAQTFIAFRLLSFRFAAVPRAVSRVSS